MAKLSAQRYQHLMSLGSLRLIGIIILLWFAGLGAAGQFAKFAVPFADLQAQYRDAGTQVGWLLTLISAVGAMFGMTAGILVTRLGYARVLIGALLLGGALSLWQATLPGMPMMLLSRFIEGISHLAIVVAAPTLMTQLSGPRYRGVVMTLWSTFFGVSFALTAWFGLPAVQSAGLETLFAMHGVFMIGLTAVLFFSMERIKATAPVQNNDDYPKDILAQHISAYTSPFIAAPAFGWLFYTLTFVSLLAILPGELDIDMKVTVTSLMPLISIATALVMVSALISFATATAVVVFGFALAIVVIGLMFVEFSLPILCVALFAALGLVQGASFAAVPELNKKAETQALAYGAMAQLGNIGNLLGTPLLLAIKVSVGFSSMLIAVGTLYALGGLTHVYLSMRRRAFSNR